MAIEICYTSRDIHFPAWLVFEILCVTQVKVGDSTRLSALKWATFIRRFFSFVVWIYDCDIICQIKHNYSGQMSNEFIPFWYECNDVEYECILLSFDIFHGSFVEFWLIPGVKGDAHDDHLRELGLLRTSFCLHVNTHPLENEFCENELIVGLKKMSVNYQ